MRWRVEITEHNGDARLLRDVLEARSIRLHEEADKRFLVGDPFEALPTAGEVHALASRVQSIAAEIEEAHSDKSSDISVVTFAEFAKQFFDFPQYKTARLSAPFGSAVNPLTGEKDDTEYVPVRYRVDSGGPDYGTKEIADHLREGRHVVLLGEYGSGKSRCIRELFRHLAENTNTDFCHPLAVDLREAWGLKRWTELIRRHFDDLGLEAICNSAIKAFNAGSVGNGRTTHWAYSRAIGWYDQR